MQCYDYPEKIEVVKDIWLEFDGPMSDGEPVGWTTKQPKFDNGMVPAGTILTFSHLYQGAGNYNASDGIDTPEFIMEDINNLIAEKAIIVERSLQCVR